MAGNPQQKSTLNKTLLYVVKLLYHYNMTQWFIAYGTLLGIVRNKSCIDGDDDIDIVCNQMDTEKLKHLFTLNGFKITLVYNHFFRIEKNNYSPVDFYCATVNGDDYHDVWENSIWKNASLNGTFIKKKWHGTYLQLPYQYVTKLKKRYGKTWRIPLKSKGTKKTRDKLKIEIL